MGRLEDLRSFVEAQPDNPFPRFAVAMELKNTGRLEEASQAFADLFSRAADYIPAFLQAGAVLAALGRKDEAAALYRRGAEAAGKKNEHHAKSQIEAALADLEHTK
jgi:tetratricopeptide (TPR) repeat protein